MLVKVWPPSCAAQVCLRADLRVKCAQGRSQFRIALFRLAAAPGDYTGGCHNGNQNKAYGPNHGLTVTGGPTRRALGGFGKLIFFQLTTGITWHLETFSVG